MLPGSVWCNLSLLLGVLRFVRGAVPPRHHIPLTLPWAVACPMARQLTCLLWLPLQRAPLPYSFYCIGF